MKSYNGFTPHQRNKAQRWLNSRWGAGLLDRPVRCEACGQDQGVIHAHAEDYSEPFSAGRTDEYHLCYVCHMMVHCRFNSPASWAAYKAAVAGGARFAPEHQFQVFASRFLRSEMPRPAAIGNPPADRVLDRIA